MRLLDQILGDCPVSTDSVSSVDEEVMRIRDAMLERSRLIYGSGRVVPVIADEPARYLLDTERAGGSYDEVLPDLRNLAPPHDLMWVEWKASWNLGMSSKFGVLAKATPTPSGGWEYECFRFSQHHGFEHVSSSMIEFNGCTRVLVGSSGELIDTYVPEVDHAAGVKDPTGPGHAWTTLREWSTVVFLLAVNLMHCRGAVLKTRKPSETLNKIRGRASRAMTVFKVLDIGLPARRCIEESQAAGGSARDGLRVHLRRGNFATYVADRPHVSGFVGTMWRRPTVVGSGPGRIEKVYNVRTPAEVLQDELSETQGGQA